ncbi:zinc finger protein ZAT9-like [Heracleum sosnowskyi]|uniref:Zinc finger protein ZAT9-like n=1 Tax=Heracleum sosnowskyi TaxID=360622 RepID=A0AAD8IXM7_9APIA|nr:zinc finger protein ZAT9-like [Heracleum sosnowskyi]
METFKCKLCFRGFANGRALGGHMRSHMLNLYVPEKQQELGHEYESFQSYSDEENENVDKGLLNYELRENPKKSFRLVDPEFSVAAVGASSVVVQDRESESESFKNDDHDGLVRRSKRINNYDHEILGCDSKKSKDKWRSPKRINKFISMDYFDVYNDDEEEEEDEDEEEEEVVKIHKSGNKGKGKYRCETCNKVFKSYQALGGHRASHKKIKVVNVEENEKDNKFNSNAGGVEVKIHECPVCFRVFASGQALGGHKRSHGLGLSNGIVSATTKNQTQCISSLQEHRNLNTVNRFSKYGGETTIDLNLPAPVYEDEFSSQVEVSAVSDAEFVHP